MFYSNCIPLDELFDGEKWKLNQCFDNTEIFQRYCLKSFGLPSTSVILFYIMLNKFRNKDVFQNWLKVIKTVIQYFDGL